MVTENGGINISVLIYPIKRVKTYTVFFIYILYLSFAWGLSVWSRQALQILQHMRLIGGCKREWLSG